MNLHGKRWMQVGFALLAVALGILAVEWKGPKQENAPLPSGHQTMRVFPSEASSEGSSPAEEGEISESNVPEEHSVFPESRPSGSSDRPSALGRALVGRVLKKKPVHDPQSTGIGKTQVELPLAFLEPPAGWNEDQRARLCALQETFAKESGAGNEEQDPADPAYLRRWQDAQWRSDQLFRMWFGNQAYNTMLQQRNWNRP